MDKLYAEVSQKLGKIDVLFVNAGVAKFAPLADTSESTYRREVRHQHQGSVLHHPKGAAAAERRRVDHPEHQRGGQQRDHRGERLRGNEGGAALSGANRGGGTRGPRHPRKHGCARARLKRRSSAGPGCRSKPSMNSQRESSNRIPMKRFGTARGSGGRRGIPGLAGCVLHHRRGNQRGRRLRTALSRGTVGGRLATASSAGKPASSLPRPGSCGFGSLHGWTTARKCPAAHTRASEPGPCAGA